MADAQPLRRSTRLRRKPLRYAEVGTLSFPACTFLYFIRSEHAWRKEQIASARSLEWKRFHLTHLLNAHLKQPALVALEPSVRKELGDLLVRYEPRPGDRPSWLDSLVLRYRRRLVAELPYHPLWRD